MGINYDITALLGDEIKGVSGQDAVNVLLEKKSGHVKAAFIREDIGTIDLIWGDETCGLCHIIKQREKQGTDPTEFLSDIEDVITYGIISKNRKGRFEIFYNRKIAIVSPELRGNKLTFLLTAYKTRKKPKSC